VRDDDLLGRRGKRPRQHNIGQAERQEAADQIGHGEERAWFVGQPRKERWPGALFITTQAHGGFIARIVAIHLPPGKDEGV
jgi:hypothetical protein